MGEVVQQTDRRKDRRKEVVQHKKEVGWLENPAACLRGQEKKQGEKNTDTDAERIQPGGRR